MKNKLILYLFALLAGLGGLFTTFILMNSFSKMTAVILVGILYFFLSLAVGRLPMKKLWLGWLLLIFPVFITFFPSAFGYFQTPDSAVWGTDLQVALASLAIIPSITGLAGIYWGNKSFKARQSSTPADEKKLSFQRILSVLGNTVLVTGLGFAGMIAVMLIGFLTYMLKIKVSTYVSYPLVFALIAGAWSYYHNNWLKNALLICLLPAFYFLVLMPAKHPISWRQPDWSDPNLGMMLTMIVTIMVALLTAYFSDKKGATRRMQ